MMTVHFYGRKNIPSSGTLLKFARQITRGLKPFHRNGEISVIFTSDREIRMINKTFLKHEGPTDVISFNYLSGDGSPNNPFGDIYISCDTAQKQAEERKHSLKQELALLVVHGLLHLAGYEDKTLQKKKIMFHQQKLLFKRHAPDLAPPDMR